jgi:RNA polymerase sigma-70 factor, ECF subfamily
VISESELTAVIKETKLVVLSAVQKHLPERFSHAVDDVVQETYIRAVKSLKKGSFRNDAKVTTWIYTIARNESIRMAERLAKDEKHTADLDDAVASPWSEEDHLEEEVLYGAIDKLPVKYRDVMALVAEGSSEKEVALKLGIKQGTVKSRSSRGRELLLKIMEGDMA